MEAVQRRVLAEVAPQRHLRFYEGPDPGEADVYDDGKGSFCTPQGIPLKPWFPPVGRFARLMGSERINLPWDRYRFPAGFIERAVYWVEKGIVRIRGGETGD